jgi:hypothetical protein
VWSPSAVGAATLTLRLPVEADEALPDNNEQIFRINVRVETLKVLVVDSLPRWEYRYLRNALARDPASMNCILFHPGMSPGGGRHYLSAFPGTKDLMSHYDVIFLGDIGIGENELTEKDAELIKGLVEQQSSGLVFLPGRRGRQLTFLKSPLKDLLPVVLDESRPDGWPCRTNPRWCSQPSANGTCCLGSTRMKVAMMKFGNSCPDFSGRRRLRKAGPARKCSRCTPPSEIPGAEFPCWSHGHSAAGKFCSWERTAHGAGAAGWKTGIITGSGAKSSAGWRISGTFPKRREFA